MMFEELFDLLGIAIPLLVFIPMILLIIYFIVVVRSNKKNGIKVRATIKSIERVNQRDNNDNIYNTEFVIMCNFEYNGPHESKLFYNFKTDYKKLKPGDQIECIYNTKKDYLTTKDNIKGTNLIIWILVATILFFSITPVLFHFLPELLFDENNFNQQNLTNFAVIVVLIEKIAKFGAFVLFEYIGYRLYDKDKTKGNYIKLKGKVIDYHADVDSENYTMYSPEIIFEYNGKKERYVSSRWSSSRKYKVGQEIDIYYNPENGSIYEKGKNILAIIMMIFGLIILFY